MDRFEYVMVLISIIVGLSIAHMLMGVAGLIDRKAEGRDIKLSWAHGLWLAYVFTWTVQFWWWEFRFSELVTEWTLGLYLFLVTYAVSLFLLAAILVPRSWQGVTDLDDFFLKRRLWYYWVLAWATMVDVVDGLLKGGWSYLVDILGWSIWLLWGTAVIALIVGLRSRQIRHHEIGAAAVFIAQLIQSFNDLATLGF
ncbi:MAG: hypothetical protein R3200_11460 [Xanthomonadales bacterium]|nr:hypothetical protein [Xanthomonadales bacterium]